MKKNLLFIIPSLSAGGGEKSLINLLNLIDYSKYNVDLFLFSISGVFFKSLPKEVKVIGLTDKYKAFTNKIPLSISNFLRNGEFRLAYYRLMFSIINRIIRNKDSAEQYSWKYKSFAFDIIDKEYDVAIGYLEKSSIYYVIDKVKAKRKIGWIHTNYENTGMKRRIDNPYFERLDYIITVSEECSKSLRDNFIQLKDKIKVIKNIVSPTIIKSLSKRDIYDWSDEGYINILTVARLSYEKGIDIAINSCKLLINKGFKIKWFVLGSGDYHTKLEEMITSNNLEKNFILLGVKDNPYPYLKKADIYVQPSRYEGKSMAVDEAKILNKPIIVTNYKTATDQITNEVNGLIVEMNEIGLSSGIEKLIKNPDLKNKLIRNLSREKLGSEDEILKFYNLIGGSNEEKFAIYNE